MKYQVSYQALLPAPGSVRVVREDGKEFIDGVWSEKKRELFDGFWTDTLAKEGKDRAFHVQFVQCQPEAASIAEFTKEWGAVGGEAVGEPNPRGLGRLYGSRRFRISVSVWSSYQAKVKQIWELLAKPASRRNLQNAESFAPLFHFGPSGRDWTGIKLSLDPVREHGQRYLRPVLRPTSEWVSLLVMLWLDVAARSATFGVCENPKCGTPFRTSRANQKFCSSECAHRHHNLANYHRTKRKKRRS